VLRTSPNSKSFLASINASVCRRKTEKKYINFVELCHASIHEDVGKAVKVHCTIRDSTADNEISLYTAVVGGGPGANGSQFNSNETRSEDGPNMLPPLSFTSQQGVISQRPESSTPL
jgi:hypothetical protein